MPEQDTLVKLAFITIRAGIRLPHLSESIIIIITTHPARPFPLLSPTSLEYQHSTVQSLPLRTVVAAPHSRSLIRHLDLPQHRSTAQLHLEPTQVLRPTLCLEGAAAVKVLLLLSPFRAVTLYDRDRLLPLTACDQTEDEILHLSVHNVLVHSMHATTRHVPLLCPSTGICPL